MFRALSLCLLAGTVGVAGYLVGRLHSAQQLQPYLSEAALELRPLAERYGSRNSEHGEEWILRDFFKDKRNGVFVDVGANDYRSYSNTYFLEVELGWSGVAIEPQTKFSEDYARYRPKTVFVPLFVADTSNEDAVLYVPKNDLVASSSRGFAEARGGEVQTVRAMTTTLDDVLTRLQIERLDFLSMDIELAEPAALAGFSLQHFRPALVCIEGHPEVRQQILEYFARNGYVIAGQYLRADSLNLWFVPLDP